MQGEKLFIAETSFLDFKCCSNEKFAFQLSISEPCARKAPARDGRANGKEGEEKRRGQKDRRGGTVEKSWEVEIDFHISVLFS